MSPEQAAKALMRSKAWDIDNGPEATLRMLAAFRRAGENAALERAARACETGWFYPDKRTVWDRIRSLKSRAPRKAVK